MSRLSQADQSALLCGLHELYAQTNLHSLRETLVRVATRLVPCDLGSYNEYLRADARPVFALRFPDSIDVVKHSPAFRAFFGEHPVARHNRETGDTNARKLSDFLTAPQLGRLNLYNEYYREIGVLLRRLGQRALVQIGNEHNFVWKRGDSFFHVAKKWPSKVAKHRFRAFTSITGKSGFIGKPSPATASGTRCPKSEGNRHISRCQPLQTKADR